MEYKLFNYPEEYKSEIIKNHKDLLNSVITNSDEIKTDKDIINTYVRFAKSGSIIDHLDDGEIFEKLKKLISMNILMEESVEHKNEESKNNNISELLNVFKTVSNIEKEKNTVKRLNLLKTLKEQINKDDFLDLEKYDNDKFRNNTFFGSKRGNSKVLSEKVKKDIIYLANSLISNIDIIINKTEEKKNTLVKAKKEKQQLEKEVVKKEEELITVKKEKELTEEEKQNLEKKVLEVQKEKEASEKRAEEILTGTLTTLGEKEEKIEKIEEINKELVSELEALKENYDKVIEKLKDMATSPKMHLRDMLDSNAKLLRQEDLISNFEKGIEEYLKESENSIKQYVEAVKDEAKKREAIEEFKKTANTIKEFVKTVKSGNVSSEDVKKLGSFLQNSYSFLRSLNRLELAAVVLAFSISIILSGIVGGGITFLGKKLFDDVKKVRVDNSGIKAIKTINNNLENLNKKLD